MILLIAFFSTILLFPLDSSAVQSIDLNGELPPNYTLIVGEISGELIGQNRVSDINGDSNLDLIVNTLGVNGGKVYVFLGPFQNNQILSTSNASFVIVGQQLSDFLVAYENPVDLNGDGINDLIVRGPQHNVYLVWGGSQLNSLSGNIQINLLKDVVIDVFGNSVFSLRIATGKVNNDSIYDIIIGISGSSSGTISPFYLFYGGTSWKDTLNTGDENLKINFSNGTPDVFLDDLNSDDFDEIIMGAANGSNLNNIQSGNVVVFENNLDFDSLLTNIDSDLSFFGNDNYKSFGRMVEPANFLDLSSKSLAVREGLILSSLPNWTPHNIYVLSSQQFTNIDTVDLNQTTPAIQFFAEFDLDSFLGFEFQKVNGNEFDDLVITDEISGGDWKGKVYVYFGGNPSLSGQIPLSNETADLVILGGKTNDYIQYPEFVDLNSDGYKDTIIPIPGYDTATQSGVGAVMIVWGDSLGFDNDPIPNAGIDQIGEIDSLVFLDGSKTYDIDGDSLSFLWTQVSGTAVSLQDANQETASFVVPSTAPNGEELIFSLEVTSNAFVVYDTTKVTVLDPTISAEENSNLPQGFSLSQNFPNPFNPTTVIGYQLPVNSGGKLVVFNILGEVVKELELSENKGSVVWNGTDSFGKEVGSGIYFYRLEFGKIRETKKMLLLR